MQNFMKKEVFEKQMTELYDQHQDLTIEFANKKHEIEVFNKNHAANIAAAQKIYIKPEPVTKKLKTTSDPPKVSVFAKTSLNATSKIKTSTSTSATPGTDSANTSINDNDLSSVSSN
jgi:hypothetical protein